MIFRCKGKDRNNNAFLFPATFIYCWERCRCPVSPFRPLHPPPAPPQAPACPLPVSMGCSFSLCSEFSSLPFFFPHNNYRAYGYAKKKKWEGERERELNATKNPLAVRTFRRRFSYDCDTLLARTNPGALSASCICVHPAPGVRRRAPRLVGLVSSFRIMSLASVTMKWPLWIIPPLPHCLLVNWFAWFVLFGLFAPKARWNTEVNITQAWEALSSLYNCFHGVLVE